MLFMNALYFFLLQPFLKFFELSSFLFVSSLNLTNLSELAIVYIFLPLAFVVSEFTHQLANGVVLRLQWRTSLVNTA